MGRVLAPLPSEDFTQVDLSPNDAVCHLCDKATHNSSSILMPLCRCLECPYVRQQVHPVCLSKYRGMTSRMCPGSCECQQRAEEQEGGQGGNTRAWSPLLRIKDLVSATPAVVEAGSKSELSTARLPPSTAPPQPESGAAKQRRASEQGSGSFAGGSDKARALLQHRRSTNSRPPLLTQHSAMTIEEVSLETGRVGGPGVDSLSPTSRTFVTPVFVRTKNLKALKKRNSDPPRLSPSLVSAPPSPPLTPESSHPSPGPAARPKRGSCSSLPLMQPAEVPESLFPAALAPRPLLDLSVGELEDLHAHLQNLLERKSLRLVLLLQQQERLEASVGTKRAHAAQLCDLFMATTSQACRSTGSLVGAVFSQGSGVMSGAGHSQHRIAPRMATSG